MTACTEKEAAEKWCPHARVIWVLGGEAAPGVGNVVFHSDTGESNPVKCIGSRCMQWRWIETMNLRPVGENPRGYCGLAGKP